MRVPPSPKFAYSGLTLVLDRPSRFDKRGELLSGHAGQYADSCLIAAGYSHVHRGTVDIRTLDSVEPLLPDTKCLLLLGESTLQKYKPNFTLNEQRGAPFLVDYGSTKLPCVATYTPQDAYDRRDYFSADSDDEDDKDEKETAEGKSTHGITNRKNWRFWLRQDIKKSVRISQTGLSIPSPTYHFYPSTDEILHLLHTTKGQDIYFDIETDNELQLTCFGFGFDEKDIYVVPMLQTHIPVPRYYYSATCLILRGLCVALRDNRPVIHNSLFDLFVLAWRYRLPLELKCGVFDTMLSHNRCFIEQEKSLGHVMSLYTDLPYHKNEGVFEPHNHAQANQLYEYNGKDVFALTQIKPGIETTARRLKAEESVEQVNRMVMPYLTMTLQGMKLDTDKIKTIVDHHERYNVQIRRILSKIAKNEDFNPNSWQQVSDYLYGSTFKNGEGKSFTIPEPDDAPTAEKTLLTLLLKYDLPAIYGILKYRGNQKRISKAGVKTKNGNPRFYYGPHLITNTTPRLTCQWKLGKTVTMRLGSSKLLRRWGDNTQNYEKELRKIVVPDEGRVFLQPDQSGAEALIVAYLCSPGNYRDLFLYNINPHCFLGLHLFYEQFSAELGYNLRPYTELSARDLSSEAKWQEISKCIKASDDWVPERRFYFIAKQGNHSLNYDARARAFASNTLQKSEGAVHLTTNEAQIVIDTRKRLFPEISAWQREVVNEVRRSLMLRNLFGHPRCFTGWTDESAYKEWYAFSPQSTVGQITNYAIVELQERIQQDDPLLRGTDILQNNHDSLLAQCVAGREKEVGAELCKHLNRKLTSPRGEVFSMKSELSVGKSWGEMEKLKI